jgi:hypothetical protein
VNDDEQKAYDQLAQNARTFYDSTLDAFAALVNKGLLSPEAVVSVCIATASRFALMATHGDTKAAAGMLEAKAGSKAEHMRDDEPDYRASLN